MSSQILRACENYNATDHTPFITENQSILDYYGYLQEGSFEEGEAGEGG
jgi:hypothetical protein